MCVVYHELPPKNIFVNVLFHYFACSLLRVVHWIFCGTGDCFYCSMFAVVCQDCSHCLIAQRKILEAFLGYDDDCFCFYAV